jgi:phosphoglycolate phosphatase
MALNPNLLRAMSAPLLVFDLDGTLADTAPDLLGSLRAVLLRHGFAADPDPALRDGIGHGARYLIEFALGQQRIATDRVLVDAIHRDFLRHYEENICVETQVYSGLPELLDRLAAAGWRFAVCTNKPEGFSRLLLERLGLGRRFAAICGGDTFPARKPHPGHVLGTIEAAGGRPDSAIMVGDSHTDCDAARAASIPFVGVSFGYTPVPMSVLRPDLLIDDYADLTLPAAQRLLATAQRASKASTEARTLDFADLRPYSIATPAGQGA